MIIVRIPLYNNCQLQSSTLVSCHAQNPARPTAMIYWLRYNRIKILVLDRSALSACMVTSSDRRVCLTSSLDSENIKVASEPELFSNRPIKFVLASK